MREKKSVEDNHGDALTEDNTYGNNLKTKKKEKERKWKTSPNKSLPAQYVCAWSLILNLLILLQLQKIWTWSSSPRFTLSHLDVFKSADGPKASHITPSGGLCSGEFQTCNSPPMQFHKQRWCLDILFLQRREGKKENNNLKILWTSTVTELWWKWFNSLT